MEEIKSRPTLFETLLILLISIDCKCLVIYYLHTWHRPLNSYNSITSSYNNSLNPDFLINTQKIKLD